MKAEKLIANSDSTYQELLDTAERLWNQFHYLRVSIVPGFDRSIDQNSMLFELYTHIANWNYGNDIELARAECKLDIGLSILRRDDAHLNELCARTIDLLSREEQLAFIKTMSVTSDMSRDQATECISTIMDTYAAQGIIWPPYLTRDKKKLKRAA